MKTTWRLTGVILMLWSASATSQVLSEAEHCATDVGRLCPGVVPGSNRLEDCVKEHLHDVSEPCLLALAKFGEVRETNDECSGHLQQKCAGIEPAQFGACLRSAVASLSNTCKDALARAISRKR